MLLDVNQCWTSFKVAKKPREKNVFCIANVTTKLHPTTYLIIIIVLGRRCNSQYRVVPHHWMPGPPHRLVGRDLRLRRLERQRADVDIGLLVVFCRVRAADARLGVTGELVL